MIIFRTVENGSVCKVHYIIIVFLCVHSGENSDVVELGRLLQLILGCAVNCDDKQEYIQRIMAMEESVQHVVMNAIQEVCADVDNKRKVGNKRVSLFRFGCCLHFLYLTH